MSSFLCVSPGCIYFRGIKFKYISVICLCGCERIEDFFKLRIKVELYDFPHPFDGLWKCHLFLNDPKFDKPGLDETNL